MPTDKDDARGLTALCPIKNGSDGGQSFAARTRQLLQDLPLHENSPMCGVPNTYLCRFYILNDVFFEGGPPRATLLQTLLTGFRSLANEEHLKSKYLVFSSNFYGDPDTYVGGMWDNAREAVEAIWEHCVAFEEVQNSADFVGYLKRCEVKNNLFFNSRFVFANQGVPAAELQQAFQAFVERTKPTDLTGPTWQAGASTETVVNGG
jgi:hypothetical protein